MALLQELVDMIQQPLAGNDANWYQFVSDHVPAIRANCRIETVSIDTMNLCQNNLPRLLRTMGVSSEFDWIVYLINRFNSDVGFTSSGNKAIKIFIPTQAQIEELWDLYQTSSQATSVISS